MTSFSQRIGKKPLTKNLQLESMDADLKNSLWNLVKVFILDKISDYSQYGGETDFDRFSLLLWHEFFKLPIDTIPNQNSKVVHLVRDKFFNCYWFEVYDLIEYLSQVDFKRVNNYDFIQSVNVLLENEFSGYRFIDGKIAPISNTLEIQEVEEAINQNSNFTSLSGANVHLRKSLDKLSDKKNPDYRNSIKESISAVETTCRVLTGESTLGKALNKLESVGLGLDNQLKAGFDKIYAYTNSKESGIRHAIMEEHKSPDFHEAKYMLVSCSAFINYVIGKANSLGIQIN